MQRLTAIYLVVIALVLVGSYFYVVTFQPGKTAPRTLSVPNDYGTVASAISHSGTGDTIRVKSGTYNETLTINWKLTLIGAGSANTFIVGDAGSSSGGGAVIAINATGVTVSGFTVRSSRSGSGIPLDGIRVTADNCKVSDNTVENCNNGIVSAINSVSSIIVQNNTVRNNANVGISLGGSTGSTASRNLNVTQNWVNSNKAGIQVTNAQTVTISGNTVSNNTYYGISIDCTNATVKGNSATGSSDPISGDGIKVAGSSIVVFENYFAYNRIGVAFAGSASNVFFHNDFVNNNQSASMASSAGSASWDNGSQGNYWSDYPAKYPNSSQTNNPVIWSTPYEIDASNVDRYPLASLFVP
jgi:parallel beta-helix repeat protein